MNPQIHKSNRNPLRSLIRWAFCEPPAINTRRRSLIKWLVFHGQLN